MEEREYFRELLNEFGTRLSLDPQLRQIMKKIENGKANFTDTAALSQRMGNLLGEVFGAEVLDIPAEAREAVCTALLKERYDSMNETLAAVQEALDEPLGLHLTPQKAPFPSERVEQLAHSLVDPTVKPETLRRRADKPVATVAKSFHDDYIKTNAKLRAQLGLKPTITRYGTGCCAWCSAVAGKYRFGEQPDDIFRRHDNCDCVIIYDNQVLRGKQTEDGGRSRAWEEVDPAEVEKLGSAPAVNSPEQAEKLQENALNRLTLAGERDILRVADASTATGVKPAASSKEELERKTKQYDKMLDDYASRKSKWSGDVFRTSITFMKRAIGEKNWDCSISIREDAGDKTIIHELLHARSCSHFEKSDYVKHRGLEEATVELYSQEICKQKGIVFSESYPISVGYLREINRIVGVRDKDFDFAQELFNTDMRNRYNWLRSNVSRAVNSGAISAIQQNMLESYLEALRNGVLS